MGGAQAAQVMDIVNRNKLQKMGLPANDEALAAMSDALRRRLDAESPRSSAPRGCGTTASSTRATRAASWACAWPWPPRPPTRTLRPNTFGIARF
jgi:geranyl-CoA carboxylase beta subunit